MSFKTHYTVLESHTLTVPCQCKKATNINTFGKVTQIYHYEQSFAFANEPGATASMIFTRSRESQYPTYPPFDVELLVEKFKKENGDEGYRVTPQNIDSTVMTPNLDKYLVSNQRPGHTFYKKTVEKTATVSASCLLF